MILCSLFGHKWNGCICERCGLQRQEGHDFQNFRDKNGKCVGTCKCGQVANLQHDFQFPEGRCWKVCTRCGKEFPYPEHTWERIPGTCRKKCTVCGTTDGVNPNEHDWQRVEGKCVRKCAVCGIEKDIDESEHDWQRAADRCVEKCAVCGIERKVEHTWKQMEDACLEICEVCGEARESHPYVNNRCSICGKVSPEGFMSDCVEKLLSIFPTVPLDPEGHRCFDAAHREEVREIGRQLDELGGMRAMRRVGEEFARRRPIHARKLETTWDGIGNWMG